MWQSNKQSMLQISTGLILIKLFTSLIIKLNWFSGGGGVGEGASDRQPHPALVRQIRARRRCSQHGTRPSALLHSKYRYLEPSLYQALASTLRHNGIVTRIVFNENSIASIIAVAALILTLGVNGP